MWNFASHSCNPALVVTIVYTLLSVLISFFVYADEASAIKVNSKGWSSRSKVQQTFPPSPDTGKVSQSNTAQVRPPLAPQIISEGYNNKFYNSTEGLSFSKIINLSKPFRSSPLAGNNSHLDLELALHYTCPPITVDTLRRRYGANKSLWGEWSTRRTRQFYKSQLPKSLLIDGALNLSLEQRARLAAEARHALRLYARERCILPGRLVAEFYDGVRHVQNFGYWKSEGMNWEELKQKYTKKAKRALGPDASAQDIDSFVYGKILERSCVTNTFFDEYGIRNNSSQGRHIKAAEQMINSLRLTPRHVFRLANRKWRANTTTERRTK